MVGNICAINDYLPQLLADTQLIGLILVLLLVDTVVVSVWIGLDPMERNLRNLTMVVDPEDRTVVYQTQVGPSRFSMISYFCFGFD